MQKQWQEILNSIIYHENELKDLSKKWAKIKDECSHPKLPKHDIIEEFRDTCPDCGFISYMYRL